MWLIGRVIACRVARGAVGDALHGNTTGQLRTGRLPPPPPSAHGTRLNPSGQIMHSSAHPKTHMRRAHARSFGLEDMPRKTPAGEPARMMMIMINVRQLQRRQPRGSRLPSQA